MYRLQNNVSKFSKSEESLAKTQNPRLRLKMSKTSSFEQKTLRKEFILLDFNFDNHAPKIVDNSDFQKTLKFG